ncbi:MAG: penicillin acylase family protein [Candidatus Melainabacteria bacterium]|nr:penicillin acylase family protein [Candidatus Melainabacteria bacterium]
MNKPLNILIITGLFTSICLIVVLTCTYLIFSQPKRNGEVKIAGLEDKVNIYFDNHGRPHVYAKNLHDLLFTQGYLTAQDRLFQIDVTRRAAKGELAEILGKSGLVRDKFARNIGLLKSAQDELENSSKETLEILNYYSKGITAYIEKHKYNLPLEFRILNYRPKPWKPIDSIVLVKQIAEVTDTSWQLDLIRQEIYQTIPHDRADELFEQNFPGNPIINYDAKKYLVFDDYILKKPNLLQRWNTIRQKVALRKILEAPYFKIKKTIIEAADFLRNGSDRWEGFNWGSNCWVLGVNKSKNPILANDPHMELANPSFWYPIHLIDKKDDINVLGLSIPGIPGILIGHNKKIAWGITSLSADVQDVFVGDFKDKDSLTYKNGASWETAKVIRSKIKVKNQKKPYIHETILTSCGPILDRDGSKALALKWSIFDTKGYDSVSAIWGLVKAKDWQDFRSVLKKYNGSTLSFHYADIDGNIGYQAVGIIPYRKDGIGSLPISGFSCNEHWLGNIPYEKLPHAYNPKAGYIVSANNKVVSSDYGYNLGNNFLSPFRAVRISTLLSQKDNFDLRTNQEMQKDLYSWVANYLTVQILEAYYKSKMSSKELLPVIQLLSKWDFNLNVNSPQALIFEKTYENLFKKILSNKLGKNLSNNYLKEWRAGSLALIKILIDEDKFWLPSGVKNHESLLLLSLSDAVKEIKSLTKTNDPTKWEWGKYHTLTIEHPFSKALPILSPLTNVGSIKVGGDRDTISAFGTNNNLKVVWGPSARVVIDLKNFNNAHVQIPLGTSSQLGSPYYKDQTKGWVENNDEPYVYDEKFVTKSAKETLVLKPR